MVHANLTAGKEFFKSALQQVLPTVRSMRLAASGVIAFLGILLNALTGYSQSDSTVSELPKVLNDTLSFTDRDWNVFPLIYYTPETSLAFGAGGLFYFKKPSENNNNSLSTLRGLGLYTLNKQILTEVDADLYLKDDDWRLMLLAGYYRYPFVFYGIGNNSIATNKEDYTNSYPLFRIEAKRRLRQNIFIGANGMFEYDNISKTLEGGMLENGHITGAEGGLNWGLGPLLAYDTRDNVFYPYQGWFVQIKAVYHAKSMGSDYDYNHYTADLRKFFSFPNATWPKNRLSQHTLGFQFYGEHISGSPPFHRLAELGGPEHLRGFFEGRYTDRNYASFQAEYRMPLWFIFDLAFFGATGRVAHSLNEFRFDDLKYGVGGGIRINLRPEDRLHLRLDYAYGLDHRGHFYFQFSEAF